MPMRRPTESHSDAAKRIYGTPRAGERTPRNLDSNIDTLERAADGVREVFDFDTIKRFYHLTLLECAERMPVADFARCVEVAREQLRRSE